MTENVLHPDNPVHEKALGMLDRDLIAWMTTLGSDGSPRAVPVWFFWHDGMMSILSEPGIPQGRAHPLGPTGARAPACRRSHGR